MSSHSYCCLEHAVQGDQSPKVETQKMSQKSKLPFSAKAGSEQTSTLDLLCCLPSACSSGIASL